MGCAAAATLTCGVSLMEMTGGPGSTSMFDAYSCYPGVDLSGSETIYEWIADRDGSINAIADSGPGIHEVILEDTGTCAPAPCLAGGFGFATFTAVTGHRYLIVVDTAVGASGSYTVTA